MRSLFRCWLAPLAACVLGLGLVGPGRAADEAPAGHEKGADQKLYDLLRDVINEGADLYNAGDYAGCYHLWEGSLRTLSPFLEHHPDWHKSIDGALAEARGVPVMWERAWVLRRAMDKIRDDIHPPKKAETAKPEPIEAAPRPVGGGEAPATRGPKSAGGELPKPTTLWDRLGGEKGVSKVVDDLTDVASNDPKVDFTRGGRYTLTKDDVAKFKKEMVDWVSDKTGGPFHYTGESMKKAHKGMGITDAQFDALVEDLKSVLKKDGVKGEDEHAVVEAVEATRKDIVEKKPEEEPEKKPEEKKPEEKKPEDKKPEEKKEEKKSDKNSDATIVGRVGYLVMPPTGGPVAGPGKPLPGGTITFSGQDGTVASSPIGKDGTYKVEGLKPGSYKIAVKMPGDKGDSVTLPTTYSDPEKSGITYQAKEGQQAWELVLPIAPK